MSVWLILHIYTITHKQTPGDGTPSETITLMAKKYGGQFFFEPECIMLAEQPFQERPNDYRPSKHDWKAVHRKLARARSLLTFTCQIIIGHIKNIKGQRLIIKHSLRGATVGD